MVFISCVRALCALFCTWQTVAKTCQPCAAPANHDLVDLQNMCLHFTTCFSWHPMHFMTVVLYLNGGSFAESLRQITDFQRDLLRAVLWRTDVQLWLDAISFFREHRELSTGCTWHCHSLVQEE